MLSLWASFTMLHILLLLLILCTSQVCPGANDLHFYDGSSTADIIAGDVFFEIVDPPELSYSYRIRPAKDFGVPFNQSIHFEKARLVPTIPIHSCSDILNTDELVGHIALSERGECSFVFKTVKAQQAGARAMIITESIDKWEDSMDHLIEMVDDRMDTEVNIPAGFLLGRSGATILRTLRKLNKKHAIINLPINMTHIPISKMNQPPWIAWMDTEVNIPAGFLLGRSGATILRTLRKLNKKHAIINLPINMTHIPISKMNQPPWIAW